MFADDYDASILPSFAPNEIICSFTFNIISMKKLPFLLIVVLLGNQSSIRLISAQSQYQCFATKEELKAAVILYADGTCNSGSDCGRTYGYPIDTWCLWNTTASIGVTDLSFLFYDLIDFNDDLNGWNTEKVTNMNSMFMFAEEFNGDISGWNTEKVINMGSMFKVR